MGQLHDRMEQDLILRDFILRAHGGAHREMPVTAFPLTR